MDNFNMKKYLTENKLGPYSKANETLSGEVYARMDSLADPIALADFKDNAYYVIAALREDGFNDEDILEFLKDHLNISFK
jgi:hypothetical protein